MRKKGMIIETLSSAWTLYRTTFKISFIFAMINAIVSEFFKIFALQLGAGSMINQYMKMGTLPDSLPNAGTIAILGIMSLFVTLVVYGMLISLGSEHYKQQKWEAGAIKNALDLLKSRFGLFFIGSILNGVLWIIASFFNILGLWLVASFTLILLPTIMLGNIGLLASFRENFRLLGGNFFYALQCGLIVLLLIVVKFIVYILFLNAGGGTGLNFGIEHMALVFTDALILPFIIMIMVAAYYKLNEADDRPIR